MKSIALSLIIATLTICAHAQDLYIKTFGNSYDKPILFLHGGPGYNCVNFEATTAQRLADKGFYVVVYDRRGEGRSKEISAQYTFQETMDDLLNIYQKYQLPNATLIGHSFGGVIGTLFAEKHPEKVQSLILIGAPIALQETFATIIASSKALYQTKNDSVNLRYIAMLENMNKSSIEYSSYCFMHAMQNGFYSPKNPTEEAKTIYATFRTDTVLSKYAGQMSYEAPQGFWKNEKYTTLDLTDNLKNLSKKKVPVFGLYGKNDGLYSVEQVAKLEKLIGKKNVMYWDNCSHNVFMDQQSPFIQAVQQWAK